MLLNEPEILVNNFYIRHGKNLAKTISPYCNYKKIIEHVSKNCKNLQSLECVLVNLLKINPLIVFDFKKLKTILSQFGINNLNEIIRMQNICQHNIIKQVLEEHSGLALEELIQVLYKTKPYYLTCKVFIEKLLVNFKNHKLKIDNILIKAQLYLLLLEYSGFFFNKIDILNFEKEKDIYNYKLFLDNSKIRQFFSYIQRKTIQRYKEII